VPAHSRITNLNLSGPRGAIHTVVDNVVRVTDARTAPPLAMTASSLSAGLGLNDDPHQWAARVARRTLPKGRWSTWGLRTAQPASAK
jgi:hypothetical protein